MALGSIRRRRLLAAVAVGAVTIAAPVATAAAATVPIIPDNGCISAPRGLFRCNWGPSPVYSAAGRRIGTIATSDHPQIGRLGAATIQCQAHGRRVAAPGSDDESTDVWAWALAGNGHWGWASENLADWGLGGRGERFGGFTNVPWCGGDHTGAPQLARP